MSTIGAINDRQAAEDFAQNARPTKEGVVASLAIIRKSEVPFGADALASRLDLLFLPFLSGVPTSEERVSRLQLALELAANRLARDHEIAYRHIFLEPAHREIGARRGDAFDELPKEVGFRTRKSSATVSRLEEKMLPVLADILLDSEFEQDLDSEHPRPRRIGSADPTHAFQVLSASMSLEIDNEDYRKSVLYSALRLEALLPDQRVAPIRYHTKASNPMPVDGSMTVLSDGHTYLGTLPDSQDGAVANWMVHFVHLGARQDPGDRETVELRLSFFDEAQCDRNPCITFTVDQKNVQTAHLAIRLPDAKLAETTAEARIIRSPHSNSVIVKREPLPIEDDGWVRFEFNDLLDSHQYGIFSPQLNLYK